MRFLSFDQWRELGVDALPDRVRCPSCRGSMDYCERCNYRGRIKKAELREKEIPRELTPARYSRAIIADAKALALWLAKPVEAVLQEDGLQPFTELRPAASSDAADQCRGVLRISLGREQ